jgi:hypothetical protein
MPSGPQFSSTSGASFLRTDADGLTSNPVPAPRARGAFGVQAENARRENALSNSQAARTVAGRAVDAQDCRLLLDMLGLGTDARSPRDSTEH